MGQQVVIFSVGDEEYGMPIEVVREIVRVESVHPIPKAPGYLKGLITLRGQAIPIINLHVRFGIEKENSVGAFALIAELYGSMIGFAVDNVQEVRVLEDIAPPPPLVTAPFIGGIVNLPDRIIMQLLPERILADGELESLTELVGA